VASTSDTSATDARAVEVYATAAIEKARRAAEKKLRETNLEFFVFVFCFCFFMLTYK
jgi:hypothetical protein